MKIVTPDENWDVFERAAFAKEAKDHGCDLYWKVFDLLMTEQRSKIALNIVMNLVAHLIVTTSTSSIKQAERGAKRAVAELLMPMVRIRWMSVQNSGGTAN